MTIPHPSKRPAPKICPRSERPGRGKSVRVRNYHARTLDHPIRSVGECLDGLSSRNDFLWPHESWPPMVLDGPLEVGAEGGHGPIRYSVEGYEPGRRVSFRFASPPGFHGFHRYTVEEDGGRTTIRHAIEMKISGPALVTWPLIFRPLHDALLEDSLDKVQAHLSGELWQHRRWSPWVRLLRKILAKKRKTAS